MCTAQLGIVNAVLRTDVLRSFQNESAHCCHAADYDTVELANMNRLFFRPEHAGMTKTDAAEIGRAHV